MFSQALTETELLLRLKEKQRANLTNRSRGFGFGNGVSSSGVTGHISSDDDNDDYDDAVVVEASHGTTSAGGRGGGGSGGGSRLQSRQSLRVVEDKVYLCVQRMFEASVGLLHTSIGAATERLLALFTKLYKIQVPRQTLSWVVKLHNCLISCGSDHRKITAATWCCSLELTTG
jgi:hypothetical protein